MNVQEVVCHFFCCQAVTNWADLYRNKVDESLHPTEVRYDSDHVPYQLAEKISVICLKPSNNYIPTLYFTIPGSHSFDFLTVESGSRN